MERSTEDQEKGGSFEIPDGWFVCGADFDAEEPYVTIANGDLSGEERRVPVPKSMAYYLSTHSCGSQKIHDNLIEDGRREVRNKIKAILQIVI